MKLMPNSQSCLLCFQWCIGNGLSSFKPKIIFTDEFEVKILKKWLKSLCIPSPKYKYTENFQNILIPYSQESKSKHAFFHPSPFFKQTLYRFESSHSSGMYILGVKVCSMKTDFNNGGIWRFFKKSNLIIKRNHRKAKWFYFW